MKKHFLFLGAIALASVFFSSCDKDTPTPTTPTNPTNPTNPTTPTTPTVTPPVISNVYGTLVSIQMEYSYSNPAVPMPMTIISEIGVAAFPTALGSSNLVDAGTVSVNSYDLEKQTNNSYYVMGTAGLTPASLSLDNGSDWKVGGSGSVSGFTYNHSVAFPDYTGTLPASVTKSAGITISLGSEVSNADSVYITVISGEKYVLKAVGGQASDATITAAELQDLALNSDNTAMIQVVPFRITLETINGKNYAFVKEKAVVGNITID